MFSKLSHSGVVVGLANVGGAIGFLFAIYSAAMYLFRNTITSEKIILFVAVLIAIFFFSLFSVYKILYGKYINANDKGYDLGIIKPARMRHAAYLSVQDPSYFISVTWMKMSRVLISASICLLLSFVYLSDEHSHQTVMEINETFGKVPLHSIADLFILTTACTLFIYILAVLFEINIISQKVSHKINKNIREGNRRDLEP